MCETSQIICNLSIKSLGDLAGCRKAWESEPSIKEGSTPIKVA